MEALDVGHQLRSRDGKPPVFQQFFYAGPPFASVVYLDHHLADKRPVSGFDTCQHVFFGTFGVDFEQVDPVDRMLIEKRR